MNQNKQFILVALASSMMLPCVANEQVQAAAKAALGNMTSRSISELYKVRSAASNQDRREIVVQATVAGLYAVGDAEKARKIEIELCNDGFGSAVFLSSFMDDCINCKTRSSSACGRCGGSKRTVNKEKALTVCQELLKSLTATSGKNCSNGEVKFVVADYTWSYIIKQGDVTITGVEPKTGHVKIPARLGDDDFPVKAIDRWVFKGSKDLVNVEIPGSVELIGDEAFCGCENLTSVTIPDSVEFVGEKAFAGCKNLKSVVIGRRVREIESSTFEKCASIQSVTIPNSVKRVGGSAFGDCCGLTRVVIPNDVALFRGAFKNCKNLRSVTGGGSEIRMLYDAFEGCDQLVDKNGFKIVMGWLIGYSGAGGRVTIPDSVVAIGVGAFSGRKDVTNVTIPNSVTHIYDEAFYNCKGLKNVTIPDSVTIICSYTFFGCESMVSVDIPNSVTRVGNNAFSNCKALESVKMPDSVTCIGKSAFYGCEGLISVTIPDSVKSIGEYVFGGCKGLTRASIPETFEEHKTAIFEGCKSLSLERGVTVRQLAGTQGYEERIVSYRKLAASGDVDAQFELGACYCKGKGVKKDLVEAGKWWRKAADQGHARAQFELGCLYYAGEGVEQDEAEALKLWRKAAAQGQPDAQCNLGIFYYQGTGVPRDRLEGLRLLRRAAEQGHKQAKEVLFRINWDNR